MEAAAHAHDDHDHHHDHGPDVELNPATWRDAKRYAWLLGLVIPFGPFIAWASVEASGFEPFWFFGPILVFGLFPLLDIAIGVDPTNPPDSVLKWLEQDRYYRWCTYLYIPVQYAGLVFACWLWSNGDLSVFDSIGLAVTMGVVGGIGINTAHELGHKRESSER
jgi:alkane 1-monooxygenase